MCRNRALVTGTGSYAPETVLSNDDLAQKVDTSDEWIFQRTGIRRRHIAAPGQVTSDLAFEAAIRAIEMAKIKPEELDLIIVGTTTPDLVFPSTAVRIQRRLGLSHGFAFDVQAVCTGFIYALSTANAFIRSGQAKKALVIGAETLSRILNWEDRTTCVLFGDGAGAAVLEAVEDGETDGRGICSTHLHSDGHHEDLLYTDGGVSATQSVGNIHMNGKEVFKHAVNKLADTANLALKSNNLSASDIDWLVPHQANQRIIEGTAKKLGLSMDQVVLNISEYGNTSAASIPLALDAAVRDGRIKQGDLLLLEAMGGGFTWGSAVIRW